MSAGKFKSKNLENKITLYFGNTYDPYSIFTGH